MGLKHHGLARAALATCGKPSPHRESTHRGGQRLEAMGILRKQAQSPSSTEVGSGGSALSLGSLDLEDLSSTLLKVEEESIVRELIEGVCPGEEPPRTFKPID